MLHRWGNPRRAVWGGRDVIKAVLVEDGYQQDEMAFIKSREKEVTSQGFSCADGQGKAAEVVRVRR